MVIFQNKKHKNQPVYNICGGENHFTKKKNPGWSEYTKRAYGAQLNMTNMIRNMSSNLLWSIV